MNKAARHFAGKMHVYGYEWKKRKKNSDPSILMPSRAGICEDLERREVLTFNKILLQLHLLCGSVNHCCKTAPVSC
jgi:hypothetical protein